MRISTQLFRNLSKFPKPAEEVHAAFKAVIGDAACNGCKKCTKKCQIDAIFATEIPAKKKTFNLRFQPSSWAIFF